MKRTLALALVAILSGCAGPRPLPPPAANVVPPIQWRSISGKDGAIDTNWWQAFGDPALNRVVEMALANNVDLEIAAARVEEARAQFGLAKAQRLPNLVGAASGGRQRDVNPGFGIPEVQTAGEGELSISYDLDLFGRLASASASARASLLASEAAQDNVRLGIVASAIGGYINLRALDARLIVVRDTLAARADSLKLARRRSQAGYASQLDLSESEAEYHAAEQLVPATELSISRQEDGLSLLLGDSPHAIERGVVLTDLAPPTVPVGLPSELLRRRPDIIQAEQQLVAADRSLDSARAAFMPDFQLTESGGYVASTLLATNPIGIFSFGGSILAPILDSGRLRAQEDIVASRRDQAALAYRKAALAAFREVEDALAALGRTGEQERAIEAQRDSLAQTLTLATNRYRAGYSPYLEQIDAQRNLLSTQLALIQAHADRLNATVSLFQALGGAWESTSPVGVPPASNG